jgi:4'-phosphopantetheinyl transferase
MIPPPLDAAPGLPHDRGVKLALGPGEAHLYLLDHEAIADEGTLQACDALLSPEEQARRDRYLVASGRHQQRVARALVRTTLSRYADVAPESWTFRENRYGRPEVAGPVAGPRFSLSHTAGLMALLVHRDGEAGVDVEDSLRITRPEQIADRFFAPAEVEELFSLPAECRRDRFFDYWTLKESYIKARGMGLFIPLEHFAFSFGAGRIAIAFDPRLADDGRRWHFALYQPSARHRLALARTAPPGSAPGPLSVFAAHPLEPPQPGTLPVRLPS